MRMWNETVRYVVFFTAIVALSACGQSPATVTGTMPCVAGAVSVCNCPDGTTGTSLCEAGVPGDCACGDATASADGGLTDATSADAALDATVTDMVVDSVAPDGSNPDGFGVLPCQSDKDCKPSGGVCDPLTKKCVACLIDIDCPDGHHCVAKACVAFTGCSNSLGCTSAVGPDGQSQPICDQKTGECTACTTAADCPASNDCIAKTCVPFNVCQNSTQCSKDQVCDPATNRCVQCVGIADCPSDSLCEVGNCHTFTPCASDKACTPMGMLCDVVKGKCTQCLKNADCPDIYNCQNVGVAGTGVCVLDMCAQGQGACSNNAKVTCNVVGNGFGAPVACPVQTTCIAPGGKPQCEAWTCKPGLSCDVDKLVTCSTDGLTIVKTQDCAASDGKCVAGACLPIICSAGVPFCDGQAVKQCSTDGLTATLAKNCTETEFCDNGTCNPQVCAPNQPTCVGDILKLCMDTGAGPTASAGTDCTATGQKCIAGKCQTLVCSPASVFCDGSTLKTCSPDGLTVAKSSPCGVGYFCGLGKLGDAGCQLDACAPGQPSCNGNTATICKVDGSGYEAAGTDCTPTGKVCSNGACVSLLCDPQTPLYCDGKTVKQCDSTGLNPKTLQTCASNYYCASGNCYPQVCTPNQAFCKGNLLEGCNTDGSAASLTLDCTVGGGACVSGACLPVICSPGTTKCAGVNIVTCDPTGTSWAPSNCAAQTACDAGACKPIVCTPGSTQCSGANVATCNNVGTAWTTTSCSGKTACDGGACAPVVCTPGSTQCTGVKLTTCNAPGTAWVTSSCGAQSVCDAGNCVSIVCTPGTLSCSGTLLLPCNALGTGYTSGADCAASGLVCFGGVCTSQVCAPGSIQCTGLVLQVCNADGLGFAATNCDDGQICTIDACNAVGGACTHTANKCDDGNSCTTDTCTTSCIHTPQIGATCSTGNACTAGATCGALGICSSGLSSSALTTAAGASTLGMVDSSATLARFSGATGVAVDAAGNLWVADSGNNRIRMISPGGTVSTVAGDTAAFIDGPVAVARFSGPSRVTITPQGAAVVADTANQRLRSIASGTVQTLAGSGVAGYLDGAASSAQFNMPHGLSTAPDGTIYVADTANFRIRTVTTGGVVGTLAGNGTSNSVDGAATSAAFVQPLGVCVDPGSPKIAYVADGAGHTIRKIVGGKVSTFAGLAGSFGMVNAVGSAARFNTPSDCVVDGNHDVWVVDSFNFRLRHITAAGQVTTVAGVLTPPISATDPGNQVLVNGALNVATFMHPTAVTSSSPQTFWVADNGAIRKLILAAPLCDDGIACTVDACDATSGLCTHTPLVDGQACTSGTPCVSGETCLSGACQGGTPKSCDDSNACTVDLCDAVTGTCTHSNLSSGPCTDGNACTPNDTCVSGACNGTYAALTTLAGPVGQIASGAVDGTSATARFASPLGLTTDSGGNVYVADSGNNKVRKVGTDGTTSTAAGTDTAGYVDGAATSAKFTAPSDVAVESTGSLLIADTGNNRIRRLAGSTVSSVAGAGTAGYVDGAASSAQFSGPSSVDSTCTGTIYVADPGNRRIRAISSTGTVSTLAGSGASGGTDGAATSASFVTPSCVRAAANGDVWVVDSSANTVRRIAQGNVSTVAGLYNTPGATDGAGILARFNHPTGCALDPAEDLYVADSWNYRIRKVTKYGVVSTVFGAAATPGSGATLTPADGNNLTGQLALPVGVRVGTNGTLLLSDTVAMRTLVQPLRDCSDGLECTSDSCDAVSGSCLNTPIAEAAACQDGDPCTVGETCVTGVCSNGKPACDDGDPCTADGCDPSAACVHDKIASPACCVPASQVYNFDDGTLDGATGTGFAASKTVAKSGAYSATASISTPTSDVIVFQDVWVPVGTTKVTFSYYYTSSTPGTLWGANTDTFSASANATTLWTLAAGTAEAKWNTATVDVSNLAGNPFTFVISLGRSVVPTTVLTWTVYVDDVTFVSTCP